MATRVDRGSAVGRYYDKVVDEEERRLVAYPFELPVTMRFVSGTAYQSRFHFELKIKRLQDLDRLGHDFCSDSVTG